MGACFTGFPRIHVVGDIEWQDDVDNVIQLHSRRP